MATSSQDVNIDDMSASMVEELEMILPLTDDCSICRVPERLRKFNEHFYTPKVVSIGPIHHGKEELRAMEEYKKRYLKNFLQMSQASLKEYYELVRTNETKLRNCYADPIELDSKDFVKMVLLDAIFLLITILYSIGFEQPSIGSDRIFQKPKKLLDIQLDLVLLENQLPFFIIQELFKLSNILRYSSPEERMFSSEETAVITFSISLFNRLNIKSFTFQDPPPKKEHLLALLRNFLKPPDWNPTRSPLTSFNMPSIKELSQAGVTFKVTENHNLLDIKFNNGVLEIPNLPVHGFTELFFRNLAAFEQCINDYDLLCIDYFSLMQIFTSASADAEVLIRNGIIENSLPDAQAVSTLFHNLSPSFVANPDFGYSDVVNGLNAYYAVRWNRWKATWIQRYFKAPWAIFSFAAALLLLILTILQTVCSILQVT